MGCSTSFNKLPVSLQALHMQVGSLQKLIGEKDTLLAQTKAKSREQVRPTL